MMNVFDDDTNLVEDRDWLECLGENDVDRYTFNDILPKDDLLNLQPDLLDGLDSSMNFAFGGGDYHSESNSSDSGNYSPTSSSSDQQSTSWPVEQPQACDQQWPGYVETVPAVVSTPDCTAEYQPMTREAFVPSEKYVTSNIGYADSQPSHFIRPMVLENTPPLYYQDNEQIQQQVQYNEPNRQQIVYVIQEPRNLQSNAAQTYSPLPSRANIMMLPPSMGSQSTRQTNANRYPNKRLLPPKASTFVQRCSAPSISFQENEEFLRRKEDRKLRNRTAAQMSRLRKRNEFEQLKALLTEKENECSALKSEFGELRRKIARLEAEVKRLNGNTTDTDRAKFDEPPPKRRMGAKKASGICALVFMAFIMFPGADYIPSSLMSSNLSQNKEVAPVVSRNKPRLPPAGHALIALRNQELSNMTGNSSSHDLQMFRNASYLSCPDDNSLYNSSQNIKLNADLMHWIERHDEMNFVQLRRGNFPSVIFNGRLTTNIALSTQKKFSKYLSDAQKLAEATDFEKERVDRNSTKRTPKNMDKSKRFPTDSYKNTQEKLNRERTIRHIGMIKPTESIERVQHNQRSNISNGVLIDKQEILDFTSKIQQKSDTLYVVALKDYFLLPALDSSKSVPKISLILPALSANASTSGQMTMMRIECNVVATGVFYLPNSVISLFNQSSS